MLPLVPFTNETTAYMVVGLVTIPPGQTRDVDPTLLPDYQAEATEPTPPSDWRSGLLAQKAQGIVATLPSLTQAQIEALGEAEQLGAARKTVLAAIATALLAAADAAVDQNTGADQSQEQEQKQSEQA